MITTKIKRGIALAMVLGQCLLGSTQVLGQAYSFEASTGTYEDLKGSTSLNNGALWDDPDFEVPIGFTFKIFNSSVTSLFFDEESFGGDIIAPTGKPNIFHNVVAYGSDLADRGLLTEDSAVQISYSNISYLLEGNAGSRILKVEWKNAGFFDDMDENDTSIDYINFQCWFYEGSNNIEIHFGPKSISQPDLVFYDDPGPYFGLIKNANFQDFTLDSAYLLQGDPRQPEMRALSLMELDTFEHWFVDSIVPENTIYRFVYKPGSNSSVALVDGGEIKIYPNPVEDLLQLDLSTIEETSVHVTISDANGRSVIESDLDNKIQTLNVTRLVPGMYTLSITTLSETVSTKLVKLP